ncbi:hypothetical protein KQX54_018951 [Cotesia glomerata]|uniref:Uncharacterized protein n=1 Tax=Cotesia glomerata TaxID=32391 RepID=A0AAV7IDC6_COTGL|nr:hypothetical protein KQX54_018951 [Cotesia glomerata]
MDRISEWNFGRPPNYPKTLRAEHVEDVGFTNTSYPRAMTVPPSSSSSSSFPAYVRIVHSDRALLSVGVLLNSETDNGANLGMYVYVWLQDYPSLPGSHNSS